MTEKLLELLKIAIESGKNVKVMQHPNGATEASVECPIQGCVPPRDDDGK